MFANNVRECSCCAHQNPSSENPTDSHNNNHNHGDNQDETARSQMNMRFRLGAALVLFFLSLAITELLPLNILLGSEQNALVAAFILFAIPYLIAGFDVVASAFTNLVKGKALDENFLMTIASLAAFGLVFFPETDPHMAEGAAIMIFYQVGELFESIAVGRSRKSVEDLLNLSPLTVCVLREGVEYEVSPDNVLVGEEILVKPGERIGLDGVVVAGRSEIDTAALTGESIPRAVEAGSTVLSGCINTTGVLTVRVTKPESESMVARIQDLVKQSAQKKAHSERFISRFARVYTPCVSAVAFIIALVVPLFVGDWSSWIQRGVMFLVVSCPCALVISVPLSFFGGIGGASRNGVLIKGSNYLEALAYTGTIFFDKTGTLTTGHFKVVKILPAPGVEKEELLTCAAHIEAFSNHPIAESIQAAYDKPLDKNVVCSLEEVSGEGLIAEYHEEKVALGNERLLKRFGITIPPLNESGTCVHLCSPKGYLGSIVIGDTIKPEAPQALTSLRELGIKKAVMLTGDQESVARVVADELGIGEYHAELLPSDKLSLLEHALDDCDYSESSKTSSKKRNAIAFVGDGINDAPVLTRADVGIAMGGMGSDAAIEAADVVLMDDNLNKLVSAIRISRRTMAIVKQNIVLALGVKFAVLLLALIGFTNLWLAVFADVGVAMLAVLNALRALQKPKV